MTSRHIPGDSNLTYFTVTCHLAPIVADLSQDSDYDPNTARIDAVVTFTPKYKAGEVIHSHTSTPATGFLALPVTALIDDGYLKLRAKPDAGATPLPGTLHGLRAKIAADTGRELPVETDVRAALNYAPVRLLGNSTSLEIDPEIPLFYDFSFSNIKIDGKPANVAITGGTFEAPWEDTLIDLLDYMPLTPGPFAAPMVVGPQGPRGEQGPATISVGSTTTSLPGSDAAVTNSGTTEDVVLDFVVPRGEPGPAGPAGASDWADVTNKPEGVPGGFPVLGPDGNVPAENLPDVYAASIEDSTVVGRELVTATDEAAARSALNIDIVMVEDFRDGVLTDKQIIEAAFAAVQPGGGIKFGQGVTYNITQDLIITPFLKDGVLVDGHGSTLSGAAGVGVVLSLRGSRFATTTTLTEAVASRSATLKVADTTGFVAGDMVALRSSGELFSPDYSTGVKQEMGRVAEVVDATTLLLDGRTWNTYALGSNTVTVQRYAPIRNLKIRDLTVAGAGDGSGQHGLNVRYFDGLTLQNVTAKNCATTGLSAWEGINLNAVGCHAQDSVGFNGSQGYGFTTSEVQSVKWVGCYGTRNRHSFDCFGSRDVSIVACTAEHNSSSGISTHASTDVVKVVDCTVRECGGGIIVRGRNNTVRGNHILGTRTKFEQDDDDAFSYRAGIIIGQGGTSYDGLGGTNLILDGNLIDLSGPDFTQNFESENSGNSAIFVHSPLVNAQITNNYATGFPFSAIYNQADFNRNVLVAGNVFDCSAQTGTIKDGIFFAPRSDNAAAGNVNTDITVFGNTMSGAVRNGISIAGGSTVDVRSDRIRIYDNRIGVCGVAKVSLVDGYFGSDVSVYDTAADSDAGLVFTAGNFVEPPYVGAAAWYDSATRTMSNKTLVSPKVNEITNTAGGLALSFPDVPPLLKEDDLGLDEDGKADPRAVSNHIQAFRSAGGSVYLSAAGDAASIPLALSCKGTGGVAFRSDNATDVAKFYSRVGAVNFMYFDPALPGQDPTVGSGGETLVGLKIQNRGNATKFTSLIDKFGSTMARFGTVGVNTTTAGTNRSYLSFYPGEPNCRIVADVAGTVVNANINLEPAGTGQVTVKGNSVAVKVSVPDNSTAAGQPGQYAVNATHRYDYTGNGTTHSWGRTLLETSWAVALKPGIEEEVDANIPPEEMPETIEGEA